MPSSSAGSSPLTRGKRGDASDSAHDRGLIPAHAGKTTDAAGLKPVNLAHPRSRGENMVVIGDPSLGVWLIPAHAGKTSLTSPTSLRAWAHPRSRGENRSSAPASTSWTGSSPLTRGKHFLTCAFTAQIGQILESLELCASSESYSSPDAYATDAP